MDNKPTIKKEDQINWIVHEIGQLVTRRAFDQAVRLAVQALQLDPELENTRNDLLEVIAINSYYCSDKKLQNMGYWACELLSFSNTLPWYKRNLAKQNQSWYVKPLNDLAPFEAKDLEFQADPGYRPLNPSIANFNGQLWMIQRTVNFVITSEGHYISPGFPCINTINYLCQLDTNLNIISREEIVLPDDWPQTLWSGSNGFEDARLITQGDELWFISSMRELNVEGVHEMVYGRLRPGQANGCTFDNWKKVLPKHQRQHEKNWTPCQNSNPLEIIYGADPNHVIDLNGDTVWKNTPVIPMDYFRGGAQAIPWGDNNETWLTVIHESVIMSDGLRRYLHRFVEWNNTGSIIAFSEAFIIKNLGIEFVAGIARHPTTNDLVVSMGVQDKSSWLVTISPGHVKELLKPVDTYLTYCQERMMKFS